MSGPNGMILVSVHSQYQRASTEIHVITVIQEHHIDGHTGASRWHKITFFMKVPYLDPRPAIYSEFPLQLKEKRFIQAFRAFNCLHSAIFFKSLS